MPFGGGVKMLLFNLALCGIIVLLSLVLLISMAMKWRRAGQIIGMLMSLLSVFAMILFLSIQRASGNPDAGREFIQIYFPVMVFMAFAVTGVICSIQLIRDEKKL